MGFLTASKKAPRDCWQLLRPQGTRMQSRMCEAGPCNSNSALPH